MHSHSDLPCCELLKHLGEYLDGELDSETNELISEHIESCHNCQVVVNTLSKTIQLCKDSSEKIHLPDDVHQRLLEKLNLE